jgi:hypothetical protein
VKTSPVPTEHHTSLADSWRVSRHRSFRRSHANVKPTQPPFPHIATNCTWQLAAQAGLPVLLNAARRSSIRHARDIVLS